MQEDGIGPVGTVAYKKLGAGPREASVEGIRRVGRHRAVVMVTVRDDNVEAQPSVLKFGAGGAGRAGDVFRVNEVESSAMAATDGSSSGQG